MAEKRMRGHAWTFDGILDVDWEICAFEVLRTLTAQGKLTTEELGKYCMVNVDPDFPKKVQKGDFIVAGDNMGYGHDHDHASRSILGAGVAAVLCDSTNGNFYRNSIEWGLPVIECPGIRAATNQGDILEFDIEEGKIRNETQGTEFSFKAYPDFLLAMVVDGGLYPHLTKEFAAGKYS